MILVASLIGETATALFEILIGHNWLFVPMKEQKIQAQA